MDNNSKNNFDSEIIKNISLKKAMTSNEKLQMLRQEMRKESIDLYIIPTDDYHNSEYVSPFFKCREYVSGFTGSAGTLAVTDDSAILWADGRYFIQAENQIKDSDIILYKMGEPNVPTIDEYVKDKIRKGFLLGFDGKVISAAQGLSWENFALDNGMSICSEADLVGKIWETRPSLPNSKTFFLKETFSGETTASKLERIRAKLKEHKANCHVTTALDEIAWLYNMRGDDVLHTPVFLSYTMIFEDHCVLYTDENRIDSLSMENLKANNVEIRPYEQVYIDIKKLHRSMSILVDIARINYQLKALIPDEVKIVTSTNPILHLKALKNPIEQQNMKETYLMDGVACTKFMYWLKTNVGKIPMDEISISEYLASLRKVQKGFIDLSFDTICAYKEHAAMMHYSATEESKYEVFPEHMLLVDSGAHYRTGTTDITRTFVLGEVDEELKVHFTTVLKSMISLAKAKFLSGVTGGNLDILARSPIWNLGIDYKCGTGHGVGYVLSVHEGPASFRWQTGRDQSANIPLEEGMTLTDEPGIYVENSHGIRLENQLIVKKAENTPFGQFMAFETITLCPLDLDGVLPELMTSEEKDFLNSYHEYVRNKITPFLSEEEALWLEKYTRKI